MNEAWIHEIFDASLPSYRTQAAGITNAKFQQFTALAANIYRKILNILDECGVVYYVFAGTMIGYIRNGRMPDWVDDIDVIIFEDQIENFKKKALPKLMAAGLHCPAPRQFPGGGYHIVAFWEPKNWIASLPLGDKRKMRVPLAQIDIFFTEVTLEGTLRNLGGWGDYHRHDIPVSWVKPGRNIDLLGREVRVFQNYEEDIRKEYGDVLNNIVIASHGNVYLNLCDTPWAVFSEIYEAYVEQIPTLAEIAAPHTPRAGARVVIKESISVDKLIAAITKNQAAELVIEDRGSVFWAIDLKTIFPSLQIIAFADTPHQCARLAHISDFIDRFEVSEVDLKEFLDGYLSVLDSQKPVTVRILN